jgi:HSP20 family protein
MNTLSLFNPTFTPDVLNFFDRELANSTPDVDVRETGDAYIMEMDLPGLSEKDVEINLKDRLLSITSVKDAKKEDEKKDDAGAQYLIRERRTSSFSRRFTLPEDIDASKVEANFINGVLTITITRRPESQPRQIQIKSA